MKKNRLPLLTEVLSEAELEELGWQDIKRGAKKAAMGAATAATMAGTMAPGTAKASRG